MTAGENTLACGVLRVAYDRKSASVLFGVHAAVLKAYTEKSLSNPDTAFHEMIRLGLVRTRRDVSQSPALTEVNQDV